jgi:hypothetical protein
MLESRGFGQKWIKWVMSLVRGGGVLSPLELMMRVVPILKLVNALGRETLFTSDV